MLAKAPQIMLFQYSDLLRAADAGDRQTWAGLDTTFNWRGSRPGGRNSGLTTPSRPPTPPRRATRSTQVNGVVGKLGNPIALASYKPYQSTGEDFLHNYLGMIGIPIDLHPEFPDAAKTILLTESAKFDP